jgi:glycine dehydrogenase subunit 1
MRYLPKSPAEREQMLAEIGVSSIDDLFSVIPEEYRLTRDLDVPRQQAESEIIAYLAEARIATSGQSLLIRWCSAASS